MTVRTEKMAPTQPLRLAIEEAAAICRAEKRSDLERAIRLSASRLDRTNAIVALVGEYKQGKSTLINALLGADVCPVDDDFATSALTIVSYADAPEAKVHRTGANGRSVEPIALDRLAEFVSEDQNPANEKHVDLVEIGMPDPLLRDGLTLVDTPGVGGFGRAYAAAILGFLPAVDGLIFVTDASAELNADEVRFFAQSRKACPTVVVALSKVDLYPAWHQIADLDRQHLRRADGSDEVFALAAPLRRKAMATDDRELDRESGFPALVDAIRARILERAQDDGRTRVVTDVADALRQLASSMAVEARALEDPHRGEELTRKLAEAERRGRELRDAGARWGVMLADSFADLRMESDQRLREIMRRTWEEAERDIELIEPVAEWDAFVEKVRTRLIEESYECFRTAYQTTDDIAKRIARTIAEENSSLPDLRVEELENASVGSNRPVLPGTAGRSTGRFDWGVGMLRGAQGGGYTISWVGSVVGLTFGAPVALGAGALFAAKFVFDERKRQTERRRQEARVALKQYIDNLQFELARRMQQSINVMQRTLRDHFQAQVQELSLVQAEVARAVRDAMGADEASRKTRLAALRPRHERVVKAHVALQRFAAGK